MATLFGKTFARAELLQYVGDIRQVGGVRLATLADGPERGVRIADLTTGSGLRFTVLLDRGMILVPPPGQTSRYPGSREQVRYTRRTMTRSARAGSAPYRVAGWSAAGWTTTDRRGWRSRSAPESLVTRARLR